MLTGLAHAAVCVPDVEAAARWHSEVVGFAEDDRVIELTEYPAADVVPQESGRPSVTSVGIADVAGLQTTWCHDPWGTVIVLLQKSTDARPYWGQWIP